jgi:hypothetical protein
LLLHLSLELRSLYSLFSKASGNDNCCLDAGIDTLADDAWYGVGWRSHDSEIHSLGHIPEAFVRSDPEHLRTVRINSVRPCLGGAVKQIPEKRTANAASPVGCTDHGN